MIPSVTLRRSMRCAAALPGAAVLMLCLGGCGNNKAATAAPYTDDASASSTTTTLPGTGRPPVTVGDKNFTEQFVLGQLYSQALQAQGYSVVLNRDIGPTEVTLQALYSGRLSMYPEYLGTWNQSVAGYQRTFRTSGAALAAARRYAHAHSLELLRPTAFSDTGAIAVTVSYAFENGLRTIGDLRKVAPSMTLGAAPQFQQSPTGLPQLEQIYGFVPAAFRSLAIGDQYRALDNGTVQAAEVNSTDGQLRSGNYTVLRDPARAFGFGEVVPVVPDKVLLDEGPAFAATIDHVSALLTQNAIRELNAAVDVYHQDPAIAAKQFLQAHGLLPLTNS